MRKLLRSLTTYSVLVFCVCAQEAVNRAATSEDYYAPIQSKADIVGSAKSYGDANLVKAPKWAQWTSLGLGVWRMCVFFYTMAKYALTPAFYLLHVLHSILRPVTLLIQLIYHLVVGIPLSVLAKVSKMLYPAYLFLGSAALIGLMIGLGLAIFSRLLHVLLPSHNSSHSLPAFDTSNSSSPNLSRKALGKRPMHASPVMPKRSSPPSTRSIMSSQPSLQTPTIFEESEMSSYDDDNLDTDSDRGSTPIRSSKGYMDYKPLGAENTRRRRWN